MAREERPARGLLLCLDLECLEQGFYLCCHNQKNWTIFEVMYCSDVCILSCCLSILLTIVCSRFRLRICYDHPFCGTILDCYSSKSVKYSFGFSDNALHKSFPQSTMLSFSLLCLYSLLSTSITAVRAGRLAHCVLEIVFSFWATQQN